MRYARICEVRPRKDHRGVDLISDALPFGRFWYGQQRNRLCAIYFAFLVWDSVCARHNAIDEAAVRANQGRRSRNVMTMVALSGSFIDFHFLSLLTQVVRKVRLEVTRKGA